MSSTVCFSIDILAFETVDFHFHSVESDFQSVADVLMVGAVIFKWLKWVESVIYLFFVTFSCADIGVSSWLSCFIMPKMHA